MDRFPKIIASSVVRSAHKGESHGGVYIVDLETEEVEQVIDWNDASINWEGRGNDRGLRGIAFYQGEVYLSASDEVFVYTPEFKLVRSFRNEYLKHCHETTIANDKLYLTSTGFDSVLEYDLRSHSFVRGYCMRYRELGKWHKKVRRKFPKLLPNFWAFDPNSDNGPILGDTSHINSVSCENGTIFVSGTGLAHILAIENSKVSSYARVPYRSHNARPFKKGVLMNHTEKELVCYLDRQGNILCSVPIKRYDESKLLNASLPKDYARQAFGRGLCLLDDGLIVGGSSPATISMHSLDDSSTLKAVNLSMDVRNAVHGLEIWPY